MSRFSLMTWGTLLILIGIQLNLVESFVLSPKATELWNNRMTQYNLETVPRDYIATSNGYYRGSNTQLANNGFRTATSNYRSSIPTYQSYNSSAAVYQSSFDRTGIAGRNGAPQKLLTPPSWLCWPPIFLGSVLFLYGAASKE